MGLSVCERNGLWAHSHSQKSSLSCGFSIPPRPTLGFPLGTKKVNQSWFSGLRTRSGREFSVLLKAEASSRSVDGDLLEEELEFKPSFEEYLKAMESVRTGREKKQTDSSKRYESNNEQSRNLRDFDIEERGSREMKGVKKISFEEKGNSGNSHTLVGEGKGGKNDVGISRKSDRDSENGTWEKRKSRSVEESQRSGELEGKIDSKERGSRDLKGVKRLGFEVKGKSRNFHSLVGEGKGRENNVGINRKLERDSGNSTWEKRRSISVQESQRSGEWEGQFDFKERESRELKGVKRLGFEMKGNSRNSHSSGGDREGRENEVGIFRKLDRDFENGRGEKRRSISVQESQRSVEMSGHNFKERGSRELKGMKRLWFEEKGDSGNSHNMVLDKLEGKGSKSDLGFHRKLDVDFENGRWEERKTINVQESKRGGELEGQSFRNDNGSFRDTKMRLERNYSQVETVPHEKTSVDNVKFRRSNKPRAESSSEEEVEFERAAFKSLEEFDDVVDKPRVSRNEMEERIQKLARCLNGADIDMPEWMFSKMMRSAQIRFSDHSITRIIQILGKLGNWRRVLQLIEWLQLRDRFKSHKMRNIHTTALCVLGKARRPVEALNLFHAMQEHMSTYPDLVAYHSIAVTLGQVGLMKELFEVIDSMRSPPKKKFKPGILEKWDPRLEPDIVVYNAVLNACVRRKQWEGAFWVLQKLKEQGQQPSSMTYGLVMEVMFECGKYNLVHDFFKKVLKSSIPNALTYKVLVNTLWKEGKTDEAISAVEAMERRGIIGSAALYYDLARCLCSAGRCQEGLIQIDKICKVANKPLVVTYTGLIQACLDARNIQDGAYIYSHMHKFCSPNLVTCNIMLKAYREHGMFEEAKRLFLKMLEDVDHVSKKEDYKERVVPDIYTFDTMLHACVKEQQWDDFEFIYKQMLHHGYHFNPKRHLRMIMEVSRVGKGELLETTWKNLARAGQTPPPLLARQMFSMKLEQGDHAAALSSISSHRFSSELQVFSRNSWLNCFKENAHRFQRDTLVKLLREGSSILLVSGDDSQHLIFQNLVTSCREFLDGNVTVSQMYSNTNSQQTLVKQL